MGNAMIRVISVSLVPLQNGGNASNQNTFAANL